MARYPRRVVACACVLIGGTALTAHAQTPSSQRTTSVVGQLGLHDTAGPPSPTGATRELVCRGKEGIDLRVHENPSPRLPKQVTMALRYERPQRATVLVQQGMGSVDPGVSVNNFPGTCNWNPTLSPNVPVEPGIVYFDLPTDAQAWQAPGARDTTVNAAVNWPDVASVTRYLGASNRYWVFYVNDLTHLSISYRALQPGTALPPGPAGDDSYSHDLATGRGQRTSDAGTRTAASTTSGTGGQVQGASTGRAGSDLPAAGGAASTVPVADPLPTPTDTSRRVSAAGTTASPGGAGTRTLGAGRDHSTTSVTRMIATDSLRAGGSATDPSRSIDSSHSVSRRTRSQPGAAEARARQQRKISSGITDLVAAPGPLGVRLLFTADIPINLWRQPANVQFARRRPTWDNGEHRWGYAPGWGSAWYGTVKRMESGSRFEAVPFSKLETGVRYYYLITIEVKGESPRQRVGSFVATARQ